jgi:hypothetical protein
MTMNMPPQYNQNPTYLPRSQQPYNNISYPSNINNTYENLRPSQQNIPVNTNRSFSPNMPPQYNLNRGYSPINVQPRYNPQNIGGIPQNISR